jgi:hypothetical protein
LVKTGCRIDHVTAGTKLDDYIDEVRSGYNDEQRAHLDAVMRHFDGVSQQLARRLDAESTQREPGNKAPDR